MSKYTLTAVNDVGSSPQNKFETASMKFNHIGDGLRMLRKSAAGSSLTIEEPTGVITGFFKSAFDGTIIPHGLPQFGATTELTDISPTLTVSNPTWFDTSTEPDETRWITAAIEKANISEYTLSQWSVSDYSGVPQTATSASEKYMDKKIKFDADAIIKKLMVTNKPDTDNSVFSGSGSGSQPFVSSQNLTIATPSIGYDHLTPAQTSMVIAAVA